MMASMNAMVTLMAIRQLVGASAGLTAAPVTSRLPDGACRVLYS
jgi:hypothetical protein